MAARSTMAYILTMLREAVFDEDSEKWTDDQLQQRLDLFRRPVRRELLIKDSAEKNYYSAWKMLEGSTSSWTGDPTIAIWDNTDDGATEIDPDSYSLIDGVFTFTSDQDDDYYLDAWSYRRAYHKAAARCLRILAADSGIARVWGRGGVYHSSTPLTDLIIMHERLAGATHAKIIRVRT